MVKYADGVGTHDDLHYRGCMIRTCKRRIDMDDLPLDDLPLQRRAGRVRVLALQEH